MNYNKHWYNSNEMQKQQIETALFASVAGKHDTPLDEHFSGRHVHPTTIKHLNEHMDDYYDKAQQHLQPHEDDNLLGHNFLLARNGHGAGYFDKYYQNGDKLYKLAKKYPEVHLYPGIDGMVHHHGSSENVPEDHKFGREEDEDDDFRGGDGDIEPKGDGPKGGHALKVPEYQLAYSRAIQYSFVRENPTFNALVRNVHANVDDNLPHGVLADHIDESIPEASPIAHLIRKHAGFDPTSKPIKNVYGHWVHNHHYTGSDETDLGHVGPFGLTLQHVPEWRSDSTLNSPMLSEQEKYYAGKFPAKFIVSAYTNGAHTDHKDDDVPLQYNFEFPSHNTKDIDNFIGDLQSAHPDNHEVVNNLLKHIHGI